MTTRTITILMTLALVVAALPLFAGDEKKRCEGEIAVCAEMMAQKFRDRGWVGINLDNSEGEDKTVLSGIFENSPAEAAGLKKGDVLVALNGIPYTRDNEKELYDVYKNSKPGQTITFEVDRSGQQQEIDVTLARLPEKIVAQWIGYHIMEAHLAYEDDAGEPGKATQAEKGD